MWYQHVAPTVSVLGRSLETLVQVLLEEHRIHIPAEAARADGLC